MTAPKQQGFMEGLKKVIADVASLSVEPDADVDFVNQLQQMIQQFVKAKVGVQDQQGQGAMSQGMAPGMPGGAGGMPGGGGASPLGGPAQGLNPGAPAVDELTRLLGSQSKVA